MTARRDLALLAEGGHARRTHGGAVLPELAAHEDSFQSRLGQDVEAKRRLANAVVATIEPGETIFVDCSSSSYYVVREILEQGLHVTLLTNCVRGDGAGRRGRRAAGRPDRPGRHVPQTDPIVRRHAGPPSDRELLRRSRHLLVQRDRAAGVPDRPGPLEAEVKRAMISHSRTVSLVADTRKFEERGLNVIVPAASVNVAIWPIRPPPACAAGIRRRRRHEGLSARAVVVR